MLMKMMHDDLNGIASERVELLRPNCMFSLGVINEYLGWCHENEYTPSALGLLVYCEGNSYIGTYMTEKPKDVDIEK